MCLNKSSSFGWKGYILLSKFLKEGYIFSPNYSKFVLHMNKHGTNILPKWPPPPPRIVASFVSGGGGGGEVVQSQILQQIDQHIFS